MLFAIFPNNAQRYHYATGSGRTTVCGMMTSESQTLDALRYPPAQVASERPDGFEFSLCPTCEAVRKGHIQHRRKQH